MNHQPKNPEQTGGRLLRLVPGERRSSPERPLDYWDAVPRDGPAVFVANADLLDLGIIHGRWIDPREPEPVLRDQLVATLGGQVVQRRAWAVIDQINVGEAMLPEAPSLADLRWQVIARLDSEGRAI